MTVTIKYKIWNYLCLLFPFLFLATLLNAQNNFGDTTKIKVKFNIGVGAITSESPFSDEILIDKVISKKRKFEPFYTGKFTDEPFEHGAIFANFSSKTIFRKGYFFYANLLMESRGESYGPNDLKNVIVLPQLYGRITDTLYFGNKPIEIFVHIGDLFKYRLNQGLQIYNTDLQAVILRLKYKNYTFKIVHLPDMSKGIGLGLEELFSFNLGKAYKKNQFNVSYELNSNYPYVPPFSSYKAPAKYYRHLSFDYVYQKKNVKIYFQVGSRFFEKKFTPKSSAFVFGATYKYLNSRFIFEVNPELRYYGNLYNLYYSGYQSLYRNNDTYDHYSNTVGRYLYPLKNYFYSFSQWAVFTEYQNMDVIGVGLESSFDYKISKKTGVKTDLDYLGIYADKNYFNYFFYTLNLYFQPIDGLTISGIITNKKMNLDTHYQTHYQSKYPIFGLQLRKKLNPYW